MNKYNHGKQPKDKIQSYLQSYKKPDTFINIYKQNFIRKCQLIVFILLIIVASGLIYFLS